MPCQPGKDGNHSYLNMHSSEPSNIVTPQSPSGNYSQRSGLGVLIDNFSVTALYSLRILKIEKRKNYATDTLCLNSIQVKFCNRQL